MFSLKVEEIIRHSDTVSTIFFSGKLRSYPGQFIMLNVFGLEEIPLSLSSPNSVTVKAVGRTTEALASIPTGTIVGIRGPFGRPFSPTNKRALFVAGGIGVAPLVYLNDFLTACGAEVKLLYGVKSSYELVWVDRFDDVSISTEDGSEGVKGTVLDLLRDEDLRTYDRIYVCGPEAMLRKVLELVRKEGVEKRTEFSVERMMRCGIGLCGSCVLEDGLRVCAEGPVFRGDELPW